MRKPDQDPAPKPDQPRRRDDEAEVRFLSWDLPLIPAKDEDQR
jgi:hypothetical protein